MKKFSKIALSVAAVSAVTAAMAVSASAMTATYADGTVTLTDVAPTGQSQTLLVLDKVNLETVADTNIKQIDQKDDNTSFDTVKVGELTDGTYEVRIGGDGKIQKATFTVGDVGPEKETETIYLGDVTSDKVVDSEDVGAVLRYSTHQTTRTEQAGVTKQTKEGKTIYLGDVTTDDAVDSEDVGAILRYSTHQTTRTEQAGVEVEIVKE